MLSAVHVGEFAVLTTASGSDEIQAVSSFSLFLLSAVDLLSPSLYWPPAILIKC